MRLRSGRKGGGGGGLWRSHGLARHGSGLRDLCVDDVRQKLHLESGGDTPHGTRVLQGFPRFQPSECPRNLVEAPRNGCFRAGAETGVAARQCARWTAQMRTMCGTILAAAVRRRRTRPRGRAVDRACGENAELREGGNKGMSISAACSIYDQTTLRCRQNACCKPQ